MKERLCDKCHQPIKRGQERMEAAGLIFHWGKDKCDE